MTNEHTEAREALARLIDPERWRSSEPTSTAFTHDPEAQATYERFFWEGVEERRAPSLAAADRIIAAGWGPLPAPSDDEREAFEAWLTAGNGNSDAGGGNSGDREAFRAGWLAARRPPVPADTQSEDRCICDGARSDPEQRHPFLVHPDCPRHDSPPTPPEDVAVEWPRTKADQIDAVAQSYPFTLRGVGTTWHEAQKALVAKAAELRNSALAARPLPETEDPQNNLDLVPGAMLDVDRTVGPGTDIDNRRP